MSIFLGAFLGCFDNGFGAVNGGSTNAKITG